MAVAVQLPKEVIKAALDARIQVLKRQSNASINSLMIDLYNKDIAAIQSAINTLLELPPEQARTK